jgi:ABC-2 type transport system ATP-binding protein
MDAIVFKEVSKSFGRVCALTSSSLSIEKGHIFGFLGPSGAGKTTSIRCLMDFIRPDNGSISVLGLDAQHHSVELKKKVGYLPADHHLRPEWTGQRHIDLVTALRGNGDVLKLAERLELNLTIPVKTLSTGNRQKLAIVLAFMGQPELVVMDEPTQGLDPLLQNQFYDLLTDYQTEGGTIFMSSHNLPEVERLCTNIAIINQGRIVAEETLESLREKSSYQVVVTLASPHNELVEAFKAEGVTLLSHTSSSLHLKVTGDLAPVLKTLSHYSLTNLEISHSSLDEIFLEYYHA